MQLVPAASVYVAPPTSHQSTNAYGSACSLRASTLQHLAQCRTAAMLCIDAAASAVATASASLRCNAIRHSLLPSSYLASVCAANNRSYVYYK
eukprot:17344-Heterococcus_DN1.PRE.5